MIDAPGAMQSHHDTTKIETGWLIDGLVKRRKAVENTLSVLTEIASVMQSREFDHVLSGALVTLEHLNDVLRFFIVPDGEGSNVKIDEWDITLMSPTAPICSQLLGKEVGDTILFRGKEFVISEIE